MSTLLCCSVACISVCKSTAEDSKLCVCLCICVNVCSVHSEAGRPRVHICYGVLLSRSPYAVTQSLFFSSPTYPRWPPQSSLFNRGMQMLYTHSCHVNTDTHTHNHIHVRSTDCGKAETFSFLFFFVLFACFLLFFLTGKLCFCLTVGCVAICIIK